MKHINSLFEPDQQWISYDQGKISLTELPCDLKADLSGDCFVNLEDLAIMVLEWLECGAQDCL